MTKELLRKMATRDPDSFLDVAIERGYTSKQASVMKAEYWVAMSAEANLRSRQEITRTNNKI